MKHIPYIVALILAGALSGSIELHAQFDDCDYVRSEELEPGYGLMWSNPDQGHIWAPWYQISGLSVSPNGRWLAYGGDDGSRMKNLQTGQFLATPRFIAEPTQWSRDSRIVKLTGTAAGREFWNVETGERDTLKGSPDPKIGSIFDVWAPDGNLYFENVYGPLSDGTSLWRIPLDSSLRAGRPIYEPVSRSENIPYFPPNTIDWYITSADEDPADQRYYYSFSIVTNFNWEGRRTVRIPLPDSNWYFGGQNSWGAGNFKPQIAVGPGGEIYVPLSFRARSEEAHEYTAPFTAEELRARNASGWYRVDTSGSGLVQLVRQWSHNLGISITADGEKIYYGFLKQDSTCAIFEMDKCGRNKRQVSFQGEGISAVSNPLAPRPASALEVRCEPAVLSAGDPVVVRYALTAPGPVDLVLHDHLGRLLFRRSEHAGMGENTLLIESGALAAGIYNIMVKSQGQEGRARIVVLR